VGARRRRVVVFAAIEPFARASDAEAGLLVVVEGGLCVEWEFALAGWAAFVFPGDYDKPERRVCLWEPQSAEPGG
jgi:hypothetical protein